ncbi:MAG: Transrane protein [Hyphomicrobiales bacterium]|nr:Transrane protein [Hyphomicrobiales bacterium]
MTILQNLVDLLGLKAVLLTAFVFVPVERLFALHKGQKVLRKALLNDLVFLFVNGWLVRSALAVTFVVAMAIFSLILPAGIGPAVQSQPLWLQAAEVILIADIGQYLAHRAFHAVPFLWKFHAVHHSIEELDWVAAYRVHPLDQIATKAASLLPVFILGYSEAAIAIYYMIFQWHALLLHANVRLTVGPLKWIVASPQFHHWHHANERKAYDKNFAAQLPLLDLLGGTLHLPGNTFPEQYGVDKPLPQNYFRQLVRPFMPLPKSRASEATPAPAEENS